MKLHIPLTRERFRLLSPTSFTLHDYSSQETIPFGPGAIFSFESYKINKLVKIDTSRVQLRIRVVPDKANFTLKKYGGSADYGISLWMTMQELRELDVELLKDMP